MERAIDLPQAETTSGNYRPTLTNTDSEFSAVLEQTLASLTQKRRDHYIEWLKKRKKRLEKIGGAIREKYGENLKDAEVLEIDKALLENQRCETCNGTCCKESMRGKLNVIVKQNGGISINFKYCKFEEARLIKAEIAKNFRNAEVPAQYQDLTFEDYRVDDGNKTAVKLAKWCLESKSGLYFHGLPGVGKTMLAAIIANESVKLGRKVIFSKVADLLRNIRATFSKDSEKSEQEILQKIYDCDVLIIDDMRPERGKKFESKTLFDVIDNRYNTKRQTIITSNGTIEEIRNALDNPLDLKSGEKCLDGTRIYDRFKDMLKIAFIAGESRRGG